MPDRMWRGDVSVLHNVMLYTDQIELLIYVLESWSQEREYVDVKEVLSILKKEIK